MGDEKGGHLDRAEAAEGDQRRRRGPVEEGEAGAGRRRRARPARAGGGGPQWGGRERGREGETV